MSPFYASLSSATPSLFSILRFPSSTIIYCFSFSFSSYTYSYSYSLTPSTGSWFWIFSTSSYSNWSCSGDCWIIDYGAGYSWSGDYVGGDYSWSGDYEAGYREVLDYGDADYGGDDLLILVKVIFKFK